MKDTPASSPGQLLDGSGVATCLRVIYLEPMDPSDSPAVGVKVGDYTVPLDPDTAIEIGRMLIKAARTILAGNVPGGSRH